MTHSFVQKLVFTVIFAGIVAAFAGGHSQTASPSAPVARSLAATVVDDVPGAIRTVAR